MGLRLKDVYTIAFSSDWSPVVYRNDDCDAAKFRHTGLWCQPVGEKASHYFYHVQGIQGEFQYQCRVDYNPNTSQKLEKVCDAATTLKSITSSELKHIMESVHVAKDREFSCQHWVGNALEKLVEVGLLTQQQSDDGLDNMLAVVAQARY
ncbi:hypothetical protein F5Y17DRAFT_478534 [Xylariaceae sp. FL0594]|nr:hypothetical protein F5Y17DRAFT_478534 [Xylariaceae sp. FL0594]